MRYLHRSCQKSRKIVSIKKLASIALLLGLAASLCIAAPAFKADSYTGAARGVGGSVVVEVTFTADTIKSVRIVSQSETPTIAGTAFERVPAASVAGQTLGVDAVKGSTLTNAFTWGRIAGSGAARYATGR